MLTVTESGKEELKTISLQVVEQPGSTLRLVVNEQGQLGLIAGTEKEGDQSIEHQGETILLVDRVLSEALEGVCIDCQDEGEGPRLVLITADTGKKTTP